MENRELPKGWIETTLGEVVFEILDNRGRNPEEYSEQGIPVIDNFLINNDRKINLGDVKRFVSNDTYENFIRKHIKANDILITLVGNGYGNLCLAPNDKCVIIQNTVGLRTNESVNSFFLYYSLKFDKKKILNLDRGAAQPSVKVGDLMNIKISIPENPVEQKAIADILSSLDEKIELLEEENKTLEELAQTIFTEWFVNFNFPNADGVGYKDAGGEMVESELGMIPKGWRVGKLGEVVEIKGGKRLPSGETLTCDQTDHPYIRITDLEKNSIKTHQLQFVTEDIFNKISRYIVNDGDIILSIVGTVGLVARVDNSLDGASLTENCVKFVNIKKISSYFLYYFLISKNGQSEIDKNTVGAGIVSRK